MAVLVFTRADNKATQLVEVVSKLHSKSLFTSEPGEQLVTRLAITGTHLTITLSIVITCL